MAEDAQDKPVEPGRRYRRAGDEDHLWEVAHVTTEQPPQAVIYRVDQPVPPDVVDLDDLRDPAKFTLVDR